MSATCKLTAIWNKVKENKTPERFYIGSEFNTFFDSNINVIYDTVSDTMPEKYKRKLFPRGVTSKVEFIAAEDTPYTGCFKGWEYGALRIAEFVQTTPENPKTAPGLEVKCLRDGMSSGNILAAFAFDGQPSFNYFKNRLTTLLDEPRNECNRATIARKIAEATDYIGVNSVMEMSLYDEYGKEEEYPNWPLFIDFEPYDVYGWTDAYQNDFTAQLALIPERTVLFKVWGYDSTDYEYEVFMGWLVTDSELTTSLWADQKLFFQHHRFEEDIYARPEWAEAVPVWYEGKFSE